MLNKTRKVIDLIKIVRDEDSTAELIQAREKILTEVRIYYFCWEVIFLQICVTSISANRTSFKIYLV